MVQVGKKRAIKFWKQRMFILFVMILMIFLAFSEVIKMPHTTELKKLYNISEWVDGFAI